MISNDYLKGLFFLVLVALIWSASSVFTQYLYSDTSFHSPFLLTYMGVSLFSLWLPVWYLIHLKETGLFDPEGREEIPNHSPRSRPPSEESLNHLDHRLEQTTEEDEQQASAYFRSSPVPSFHEEEGEQRHPMMRNPEVYHKWTHYDHFYAAVRIAPVWFAANWAYNASLAFTSITSSTVLASTGSVFTFLFAVGTGDEKFGWIKLLGVLLGLCGSIITALGDVNNNNNSDDYSTSTTTTSDDPPCDSTVDYCYEMPLVGDILGLSSAIGYGAYVVQTRLYCPHDESLYSMQLLLGYIGLISMVVLAPFALWQFHVSEMTKIVFAFLCIKGLFDNAISDYLWLRAVILTSATVATVGMGLTIPLAFLGDLWQGTEDVITFGSVTGALLVLSGFVVVNAVTDDEHAIPEEPERELTNLNQNLSGDSLRPLNSWGEIETEVTCEDFPPGQRHD